MTVRNVISSSKLSDYEREQRVTLSGSRAIGYLLLVYGASLVAMVASHYLPSVFTVPLVVFSLSFVPGSLLVFGLTGRDLEVRAPFVLYALGCSLLSLMIIGVLANVALPLIGVTRPLMPLPLGVGVSLGVGVFATIAGVRNRDSTVTVPIPGFWSPAPLALLSLPLLSIVGVNLINATGFNVLLLVVLCAIALVPLAVIRYEYTRGRSLVIWTISLAILYHKSLWQYSGFGGRPQGIRAWEAGRWSAGIVSIDQYSSELVQNGVLFPLYARLSDIFIMTQYEVVNPLLISFIPLAMYVAFRQYVRADVALLGAATFAFAHPFYLQYPTAGRAATPVLFLVLFGVAISNTDLSPGVRAGLAVAFLAGVVTTHYGTSYYVAAAFLGAIVLIYALRLFDTVVGSRLQSKAPALDGGSTVLLRVSPDRKRIFTSATVLFFITASLGWYLYTRQGWKFDLLPRHAYENLIALFESPTGGRTTARILESYGSVSIEISKYIYIGLALAIAVGLATVYYQRLVSRENTFDDSYLAIGTALFGVFGSTVLLNNWGGGRPMMITFSFTTVFAVIGVVRAGDGLKRVGRAFSRSFSHTGGKIRELGPTNQSAPVYAFAVILFVFFVMNSGIASAVVFDELAPSNVPAQSDLAKSQGTERQVTAHRHTDIATHVWLVQHLDTDYTVYADTFGARQYDWYRPDVTARTPSIGGGYSPATKPEVFDLERQQAGTQAGYLLIMGHNQALGAVYPYKGGEGAPLDTFGLEKRNIVYTTGESSIYLTSSPRTN